MGELVTTASSDVTTAETRQRLAQLEAAARAYVEEVPNTKRGYDSAWRAWLSYCAAARIPDDTVAFGALVGFVAWHESHGLAPATIDHRIAAVVVRQRERGLEVPRRETDDARKALGRYKRKLAEEGRKLGRGEAPAITVAQLRRVVAELPDTNAGKRDRLILLLGFGIAARRSELSNLNIGDVVEQDEGLVVTVRFGKTGARTVPVVRGTDGTCPVRAYRAWRALLGDQPDNAPLLRPVNKADRLGLGKLSGESISKAIRTAGVVAGIPDLSGHSLRAGLATEARRAGHDAKTIGVHGGWSPNSGEVYRYMRVVDQWDDNATKGLGL